MTKKARKPVDTKQWAYRPPPTQTPQEIMSCLDAVNMVRLLDEFLSYMPATLKEGLRVNGFLEFGFRNYNILVTDKDKYERPINGYRRMVQ